MTRKLIVCLGNPGTQYQHTRHNIGWLFGDFLCERLGLSQPQPSKKFQALLSRGQTSHVEVVTAFPTTFMNDSGRATAALVNFYHLVPADDLLVVHDDLDISVGKYKFTRKLPRTHNGLASIKKELGTDQFTCLRLGVDDRQGSRMIPPMDYVLMNFPAEQLDKVYADVFPRAFKEVVAWL